MRIRPGAARAAALLPAAFLALSAAGPRAQDGRPGILGEIGIDQKLGAQVPLDLPFRDESGAPVRLGDYFGRRPVVLVLAYYECPMLCTLVLNGLASSLGVLSFEPGREFEIVTVSIDPGETPALAAAKKREYLARYRRPGAEAGWHFLTGEQPAIEALAAAVGFRYRYDPEKDLYAHASGILVLTDGGRAARYFYGVEFPPRDLRFALVEASENRIGSVVDQVLLFCYQYDPATGRYGAVAINLVRLGGILTVLVLGTWLTIMLRRESRRARATTT